MKTACIASIPEREETLKRTVESLRPQVDRIFVALNNYDRPPEFLSKNEWVILDNSMGDAGKFYITDQLEGFIFACDDDLVYPVNYVSVMIQKIRQYQCVVTMQGSIYPRPVMSFRNPLAKFRCLDDVQYDVKVELGGTGVMAWHSEIIKVKYDDFKSANMADIWMSKLCKEKGIPIYCIAHHRSFLKYFHPESTIWDTEKNKGFIEQTKLLQSFLT